MAAKPKAPAKAKAATTLSKAQAKPKGLQLSTAQWKAYNKAYSASSSASYQRIALTAATQRFRKYRLGAAYATVKKYNAAHANARRAAIAAYATKLTWNQSRYARQNAHLQNRLEQNYYNHVNLAGRLQYISTGEKAYAHAAVMKTMDTSQARSYEQAIFAAAAKAVKAARKSTAGASKSSLTGKQTAQIKAAANSAGLKAAKAVKQPKARAASSPWLGEDQTNCVLVAVLNHLLYQLRMTVPVDLIDEFNMLNGPGPDIEGTLALIYALDPWAAHGIVLHDFWPVPKGMVGRSFAQVIGYQSEYGSHAALAFPDSRIITWGEVAQRPAKIEEGWGLAWSVT